MADSIVHTESLAEARARGTRNARIRSGMREARRAGDEEGAVRLFSKQVFSADNLAACKRAFGADWIREQGLNTRLADAEFGEGWLDHEEDWLGNP